MRPKVRKEKLITVVTPLYVELLVIDLLERSFELHKTRSQQRRHRLISPRENVLSSAGVLLTITAIQGWTNRIQYLLKDHTKPLRTGVFLGNVYNRHKNIFPKDHFIKLTDEVFALRDVIAHNHIYELAVTRNENYDLLSKKQKLQPQYGYDKKWKTSVNRHSWKTNLLRLNIQPANIGFEELFKVLAYYDLFIHLSKMILGSGFVSTGVHYKFRNEWEDNLSSILATLFAESNDSKFRRELNGITKQLRVQYRESLSNGRDGYFHQLDIPDTSVAHNECPICGMFGYHKVGHASYCHACKHKITFVELTPEQKKQFFGGSD